MQKHFFKKILTDKHFIIYVILGVTNISVEFLTQQLSEKYLGWALSNILGVTVGAVWAFFMNLFFNFKTFDNLLKRSLYFFTIAFIGFLFNQASLSILHGFFQIPTLPAKIIWAPFGVVLTFILNKKITFKN